MEKVRYKYFFFALSQVNEGFFIILFVTLHYYLLEFIFITVFLSYLIHGNLDLTLLIQSWQMWVKVPLKIRLCWVVGEMGDRYPFRDASMSGNLICECRGLFQLALVFFNTILFFCVGGFWWTFFYIFMIFCGEPSFCRPHFFPFCKMKIECWGILSFSLLCAWRYFCFKNFQIQLNKSIFLCLNLKFDFNAMWGSF